MSRRAFVLALVLLTMPIAFLLTVTLAQLVVTDTRFASLRREQSQAFYLAQTALNLGYQSLAASNFARATLQPDGLTAVAGPGVLSVDYPGLEFQDGWCVWRWNPGDPSAANFAGDGQAEEFRLSVHFPSPGRWTIRSQGRHGAWTSEQIQTGQLEGLFEYAIFDAQDLSEFVRGADQTVNGKVHANGDLYFRPTGSTLTILSNSVTCAGRMVRYRDAWNRPDSGGTVRISSGSSAGSLVTMEGKSQGWTGQGKAFDSYHSAWTSGARSRWQGVVRDASLGGSARTPLAVQSLEPGGYYDEHAGLRIGPSTPEEGTWLKRKTFYNQAEGRQVTVHEVDLEAMVAAGRFPANGLLYASTPIRLAKAQLLPAGLTVACNSTLYVQGDFNQVYPNQTAYSSGTSQKKPAALITRDRIYHLTTGFSDTASYNGSIPAGSEPSRFAGDPSHRLEVNAALVDGAPTVDERNWRQDYAGQTNPYYNPVHVSGQNAWANSDDFLEGLGSITVRKRGSIVHLQNATMAPFDNSGSQTPWIVKTHYGAPVRDYGYDPDLSTNPPPFTPLVSRKVLWQQRR
ncbi:MAG: hypothetical protein AB1758_00060 [Candidatus Eremiobacterota bacterium]